MQRFFIGTILFLSVMVSFGQNIRYFNIETKLMKLGELKVTQNIDAKSHEESYKLETKLGLWSFYEIEYLLESGFKDKELTYSLSSIKVNGKLHHYAKATRKKGVNRIERLNAKDTITTQIIQSAITQLYFNNFVGKDSVFSEYSGFNKSFIKKNDTTYILNDESLMEFVFTGGKISKVLVPNSIMDFYIVEKPPVQQ